MDSNDSDKPPASTGAGDPEEDVTPEDRSTNQTTGEEPLPETSARDAATESDEEPPAGDSNGDGKNDDGKDGGGPPRRIMGPFDVVAMVVLLFAWLIPISYVGATKSDIRWLRDAFPWLAHQHRVSCLFINEVKGWSTYQVQVQSGGDDTWRQLSEEGFFEMTVFGYRTRLHRLLGHSYRRGKGLRRIREASEYIRDRYAELNPEAPGLDAVRFVRIYMSNAMLEKQQGRFKPARPDEVPKNYLRIFGETRFDGKRPRDGGYGRSKRKKRRGKRSPTTKE